MGSIKAIETSYAGCRFRSRLEARWAVFFDNMGIGWEYEPQGYEGPCGRYLPDFILPSALLAPPLGEPWSDRREWRQVHVEVKGTTDMVSDDDRARMGDLIDWGGPLESGLLLLGSIPEPGPLWSFHLAYWHKGVALADVVFEFPGTVEWVKPAYDVGSGELPSTASWEARQRLDNRNDLIEERAFKAARSARFEYGESG